MLCRVIAITVLSISIQGCLILPHAQHKTPTVYGRLTLDGHAAANIEVGLYKSAGKQSCTGESHTTVTEQDGSFQLKSFKEMRFVIVIMGHCHMPWSVCVNSKPYQGVLVQDIRYTLCSPGLKSKVEINCELNKQQENSCQSPDLPPHVLGNT